MKVAERTDIYSHERAGLFERLHALAGAGTTWREPVGSFATGFRADTVPREHTLAAALAFARDHSGPARDIGPDVLESLVLKRVVDMDRMASELMRALVDMSHTLAMVDRSILRRAATRILTECATGTEAERPKGMKANHWNAASSLGIRLLWASAGETLRAATEALR